MGKRYVQQVNETETDVIHQKEISVWTLDISTKLRNVLMRNGITNFGQVTKFTKEDMLKFRNMGIHTFEELDAVCNRHGIKIWSVDSFIEAFKTYRMQLKIFQNMFRKNIVSIHGFEGLSVSEIAEIGENKQYLIKRICETLNKNGISYNS